MGDSGDLPAAAGTRPSPLTAHSASSLLVESEETQIALTATTTTESFASTVATQMDSPVSSPPPPAAREAERDTWNQHKLIADPQTTLFHDCSISRGRYNGSGSTAPHKFAIKRELFYAEFQLDHCNCQESLPGFTKTDVHMILYIIHVQN